MSNQDLTTLSDEELNAQYRACSNELQRRYTMASIPAEISELAQQGREIGVEEATMIEAVTRTPEEVPAGEEI